MTTHPTRAADRTTLTARELEVLAALADGLTTQQVGRRLCVSFATARTHKVNLFRVLGVTCSAHAVAVGFRRGWLT